jgi:acyl-CoA thioester hydrolase
MSHTDSLPDPATIVLRRRIEWIDTDAAGIYHYTTTFRLAEAAEAAMHTALGIAERTFGVTPRVGVEMEFKRSLRFNDDVEATLAVTAVGRSSVRYAFTLAGPDGVAAVGRLTACLVDRATRRAMPWPDDMRRLLTSGGRLETA